MLKKQLLKITLFSLLTIVTLATFISCNSQKSNFRQDHLSYGMTDQPSWMTDVDLTNNTFTLDLTGNNFSEVTIIDSQNPILVGPFVLKRKIDDSEKVYLLKVAKIIFHENVTEIAPQIFMGLGDYNSLQEIIFSGNSKLKKIGAYAFAEQKILNLTLPNTVSYIGRGAFRKNPITSLNYQPSKVTIGDGAFWGNKLLNPPFEANSSIKLGIDVFGK